MRDRMMWYWLRCPHLVPPVRAGRLALRRLLQGQGRWRLLIGNPREGIMSTRTLLIIVIIVLVLAGGGYYGQGRWF